MQLDASRSVWMFRKTFQILQFIYVFRVSCNFSAPHAAGVGCGTARAGHGSMGDNEAAQDGLGHITMSGKTK